MVNDWEVYLRNVERLKNMAGRNVPSEILLTTIDTVNAYQASFVEQLRAQIDTTKK
jgi:hypothetical protein